MITQTDANGRQTTTDYTNQLTGVKDPYGRPGFVLGPLVQVTVGGSTSNHQHKVVTKYFDQTHKVEVLSDLNAQGDGKLRTKTTTDELGRVVLSESSEDGLTYALMTDTAYEEAGRLTFTSNPHRGGTAPTDGWTRATHDRLGRVVEVATFTGSARPTASATNWNGQVQTSYVQTAYLANETTVTDQAGKQRKTTTDALGRLVKVFEDPSGSNFETSYTYDALGNLKQVNQGDQQRIFTYDSLSRLRTAKNPEQVNESGQMVATSYDYDDASNLTRRTNPNNNTFVDFTYDGMNRVKTKTLSTGGTWVYTYDTLGTGVNGKGRLTSLVLQGSTDGNYFEGYDAMGRVTASHQTTTTTQGGAQSYTLSYGYDLAGDLTKQVYPSGKEYRNDYDDAGRVSQISRYNSGQFDKKYAGGFIYTAHGAVSAMGLSYSSGAPLMNETTNYNSRLQPTLMEARKAGTNELLLGLDFAYGATASTNNGNMQTQTIRIGGTTAPTWTINQSFTYDGLNRLQTATETGGWTQNYGYDRFGNRWVSVSTGYVPDANLCPTQASHVSAVTNRILINGFSYDTSGNQKTQIRNSQTENYDYDSENRLMKINNGAIGEYVYDGDGRRVKKIDNSGTTVFVYNASGQLIAEYHSDPVPPPTGGGGTSYLTTDHLGSTRLVTSASGSVKARYDYLPFGEEVPSTLGVRGSVGGYGVFDGTRQRFTQKERDNESGLDYFLARYYSSAQGRFTTPDEFTGGPDDVFDFADAASANPTFYADFTNPQSLNKYQYAYNNPLRFVDPDGHDPGQDPLELIVAYEKAQVKSFVGAIVGALTFQARAIIHPKQTLNEVKQSLSDAKDAIKMDIEMIKHPVQAASALIQIAKEDPKAVVETAGRISGESTAAILMAKGMKASAVEVEARASIIPRVEAAAKLGGNQPVGSVINATRSGAERAGQIWTGRGARPMSGRLGQTVPGAFNPATGRSFRPPTAKPYGGTVANFQTRSPKANVHVNVKWKLF